MNQGYLWIYPLASAVAVAVFTYLGVLRRSSGRIATTEADRLWAEARNLREVYQAEILRLRTEIDKLETEIEQLENEHHECRQSVSRLNGEAEELRRENKDLRERMATVEHGSNRI